MPDQDQAAPAKAAPPDTKSATAAQDAAWEAAQGGDAGWEQRRRDIDAEYGAWVATGPIQIGGALAFLEGHSVPVSHVEKFGLDRREGDAGPLVVKRDSKDGKALLDSIAARQQGE
jgi:hypothetical protein